MLKVADNVIKFIEETMESGFDSGRKNFSLRETPKRDLP